MHLQNGISTEKLIDRKNDTQQTHPHCSNLKLSILPRVISFTVCYISPVTAAHLNLVLRLNNDDVSENGNITTPPQRPLRVKNGELVTIELVNALNGDETDSLRLFRKPAAVVLRRHGDVVAGWKVRPYPKR